MARKDFPTYNEFLAFAKTHERLCLTVPTPYDINTGAQEKELTDVFGHSWTTGGWSGGSCYGGEECSGCSATGNEGEQEPEWKTLNAVIAEFCPNLTYVQFHYMMKKLAHFGQEVKNEYYGCGHVHAYHYIEAKALYDWLKEIS